MNTSIVGDKVQHKASKRKEFFRRNLDKKKSANRIIVIQTPWRSARAVDWSSLENCRTCERTVGSNPTSSFLKATLQVAFLVFQHLFVCTP